MRWETHFPGGPGPGVRTIPQGAGVCAVGARVPSEEPATAAAANVLVLRLVEEAGPRQGVERLTTLIAADVPEPGRLRDGQAEPRHLEVLGANERVEVGRVRG